MWHLRAFAKYHLMNALPPRQRAGRSSNPIDVDGLNHVLRAKTSADHISVDCELTGSKPPCSITRIMSSTGCTNV